MVDHLSSRQARLVARIRLLSAGQLRRVEELIATLECGALSPLSVGGRETTPGFRAQSTSIGGAESGKGLPHSKDWPHAPVHRLSEHGTYVVTAGTLHKEHWFREPRRIDLLESILLRLLKEAGWQLEAWAVFSNHYHFVAHSCPDARNLRDLLKQLHGDTARELNRIDRTPGRAVWHNFWDTKLTFEKSYLARLNYVHQNAVKHGLVPVANQYGWCSAAWFERAASRAQVRTIYSFKTDKLRIQDDYEPV